MLLLADLVATSQAVAATRSRNEKKAALAELLTGPANHEVVVAVGFLVSSIRQGRIGIGWATIRSLNASPADAPSLTVLDVDATIDELISITGSGSQAARRDLLGNLWSRATEPEQDFLARLFIGEMRTGALEGVMADAVAAASGVKVDLVRRAAMLRGDLREVAAIALEGGAGALADVGLVVGRAIQPMLASTAASVTEGVAQIGVASVEWKLDGARVQVHKAGDEVRVFTRNLNDITERSPETVAVVRGIDAEQLVLDGEVLALGDDGRPYAFQDTMSRFGSEQEAARHVHLSPFFFDVLHLNGEDLLEHGLTERHRVLQGLLPEAHRIPVLVTDDPVAGETFLAGALEAGHEGVMVKGANSAYEAGRRGKSWLKVKPVHTYDLVVLAAEWGHGRRQGWLSNLHLGARDPESGEFVMVGKTFKGLTDELLAWQTDRFHQLARPEQPSPYVVWLRPELVVEIALDGVQRSTRYPGGIALRFARVKRYREDKNADEADTLDTLRALLR